MNTSTPTPVLQDGERFTFMGEVVTVRLSAEHTRGALAAMEHDMPHGLATPLHVHPHEDEAIVVLDGALTIHLDGREYAAGRGALVWLPRGVPHAFRVDSETASTLAVVTPAGHEVFFRLAGDPIGTPAGPPDLERMGRAAAAAGFEILGPPPFGVAASS